MQKRKNPQILLQKSHSCKKEQTTTDINLCKKVLRSLHVIAGKPLQNTCRKVKGQSQNMHSGRCSPPKGMHESTRSPRPSLGTSVSRVNFTLFKIKFTNHVPLILNVDTMLLFIGFVHVI